MNAKCNWCDARACGVALGRWVIGVVLLFAGIKKFENVSGFVGYLTSQFEKTWLPKVLLVPYAHAVPFIEVILGALLILGIARNAVLFVAGVFFITLTFGQLLLSQPQVIFQNMIYTVVTGALLFASEYDRCVLPLRNRRLNSAVV
jgi:thiosulfate dehydrogenase [quinone] large subunit